LNIVVPIHFLTGRRIFMYSRSYNRTLLIAGSKEIKCSACTPTRYVVGSSSASIHVSQLGSIECSILHLMNEHPNHVKHAKIMSSGIPFSGLTCICIILHPFYVFWYTKPCNINRFCVNSTLIMLIIQKTLNCLDEACNLVFKALISIYKLLYYYYLL
jgi:hypothetical protein